MVSSHQAQEYPDEEDEHDEHLDDDAAIAAHYLVIPDSNITIEAQEKGVTNRGAKEASITQKPKIVDTRQETVKNSLRTQNIHPPRKRRADLSRL